MFYSAPPTSSIFIKCALQNGNYEDKTVHISGIGVASYRSDCSINLADEITLLEHQVLNQIDVIDINVPWNSARNKLRYIDLHQTVTICLQNIFCHI